MNFPEDTFCISASSLALWGKCPWLYNVTKIQKRESIRIKSGREFGSIIHKVLAYRYQNVDRLTPSELNAEQQKLLEKEFAATEFDGDDYHNLSYATALLARYAKEYPTDPFDVVKVDGKPVVERSLMVPLCTIDAPKLNPAPINVVWTGIIDALIQWPDTTLEHLDHKTSSRGGNAFFDEFNNDVAQIGYTWALHKSGFNTSGFTINALVTPKPKVGGDISFQFLRQRIHVDEDQLLEWETNTINIVMEMFHTFESNCYPLHRWNCVGKYGRCDLYELCSYQQSVRPEILKGSGFKDTKHSPIYDSL